ncbi:hypothetical protein Gohar_015945 [Gossypium harknessii]|uniref:DUF3741 domain-containing protein n=1 Tax=Gossypium harknessii TaxID=34285 RepID=A0A7J9G3H5_9ROSI|nr:hypothetical protein [Gossypium harknessii]
MTTGIMQEQNLEEQIRKQMDCMAGFLQIFDRHQILTGKRLYSTKRLRPSPASETTSEEEKVVESSVLSRELEKRPQDWLPPSPKHSKRSPVISELRSLAPEPSTPTGSQNKTSLPLPIFESKEGGARSPWKLSKDAPRLSLDSRAVADATGSLKPWEIRTNQCKSNSEENRADDNNKQRSPSVIARLMGLGYLPNLNPKPNGNVELRRSASKAIGRDLFQYRFIDGVNFHLKQNLQQNFQNEEISCNVVRENRVKQKHLIGNRSESFKNARTEPIKAPVGGIGQRKCFFDSAKFFPEPNQTGSIYGEIEKWLKLRGIDEPAKDLETLKKILEASQLKGLLQSKKPPNQTNKRNFVYEHEQSQLPIIKQGRSPASAVRRIGNDSPPSSNRSRLGPHRNLSIDVPPAMSPRRDRLGNERNQSKRSGSISPTRSECGVKSPNRRPLSVETQRRGNANRSKVEEYKDGRSLLERCDKLLHSIAEMIATTELQSSPVSVLDSSFYKDESSVSPVKKRSIDFKAAISSDDSKSVDKSDVCDFIYIFDILRASNYLLDDSDVFLLLEKQQHLKGKDTSKVSRLQRKLIFAPSVKSSTERDNCRHGSSVLRKDLAVDAINSWGDYPIEMPESVLNIERVIFKDLIVETIWDLAAASGKSNKIRRQLVF